MPNGILSVNKAPDLTSFQVVSLVRKGTGVRRVGHAGTLDPMATGVLLICLGQATRVSEYLMRLLKTYRGTITLGVDTDSYDAEGDVVQTKPVNVTRQEIADALARYVGTIEQTPPAHSAVKVGGRRAYQLARKGEAVVLQPRPVRIDRITLLGYEPPRAEIEIECGKGTYVRSLAHDVGQDLGCGAHLSALERTRVGPFAVEAALGIEELRSVLADGSWTERVLPMDCGLIEIPEVTLHIEDEKDIRHGQAVRIDEDRLARVGRPSDGGECRAYGEDGTLVALLVYDAEMSAWRPRKVFPAEGGADRQTTGLT